MASNLGNFLRRIALPQSVKLWTLTTLWDKLIKIGSKTVRHSRYVTCQLAEVAIPRRLYRTILDRIRRFAAIMPDMTGHVEKKPDVQTSGSGVSLGKPRRERPSGQAKWDSGADLWAHVLEISPNGLVLVGLGVTLV